MKHETKLYNILFPPYMLVTIIPVISTIFMGLNFIIDSIVLLVLSKFIHKKIDFTFYKKSIWKIWIFGYIGDIIGALFLFIGASFGYPYIISRDDTNSLEYMIMEGLNNITNHPGELNIYSYIYIVMAIAVSSIAIFLFDYFIAFRKSGLTKKQRLLSSLAFAVITAPYTFLLPGNLFYNR